MSPLRFGGSPALIASALFALPGCEALDGSPPEVLARAQLDASVGPCLAQTDPIIAQVGSLGVGKLVAFDLAGSTSVALDRGDFVYGATWSPDGQTIAFRRRHSTGEAVSVTELALFSPDVGGDEVVLFSDSSPTLDGVSRRYPDGTTWSPDGRQLAFASLLDSDHYRVWGMSRSGGQARPLLSDLDDVPNYDPRWSPNDTTRLAYVAERAGVPDLWVADLATGERQRLTSGQMQGLESPRWSPDGRRLAFSAMPREAAAGQAASYDIYAIALDGEELERITANAGTNVDPAWAPDGASLLVSSSRESGVGDAATGVDRLDLWRVWLDDRQDPEPLSRAVRGTNTTGADWYPLAACPSLGR